MIKYYLKLTKFNIWANQSFRNCLEKIPKEQFETIDTPYGSFLDLIVHIFAAVDLWLARISGNSPKSLKTADDYGWFSKGWVELAQNWEKIDQSLYTFVRSLRDKTALDRRINYNSTEGSNYIISISDILTHISHHSMYHRGQIAMLLRQQNLAPIPANDAIYFFLSLPSTMSKFS